ncbi:hypothetical protein HAPAU_09330 [Halalkalicoccus paucihalophilus]|jgi:hypothetical protein|uniref:Uncharacterized protein n=2 Tax=Halalkalicoccus paucihalophilus TaxID=1008153 RepID=A0A151AHF1_9EURY|nr:hypothetical protein HAPAU_09330 [Halalkalicoccus paucihalophilus]
MALISGWINPHPDSEKFISLAIDCHIMSTKATPASAVDGETEVMTSIDDADDEECVIIADITADEAWLAMPLRDAMSLPDCR